MNAITVAGLRKRYGDREVLRGVDFTVPQGSTFALLGVNGAGKTTALECIEGLRRPDAGEASVRGSVGIQLQSASLPAFIRGGEAAQLFSKWRNTAADPQMMQGLGMDELARKQYRHMSIGQKRRLHLVLALLGDPDVVFLDEPTAGLDVEGRAGLHAYLSSLRDRGKTLILASHDMAEVEELCDRIAILRDGRIAFCGTGADLQSSVGTRYNVRVRTPRGEDAYELEDAGPSLAALVQDYVDRAVPIVDLQVGRGTLEQHFVRIAKEEKAG